MKIKQPSRKKAVITQLVGGYLNTTISITQGLLLLPPLYFKFIDFTTYGYWVTIGSIISLLGMLNFGGNMVTQRISSNYAKHNYQAVADYFINSQFFYIVISFILFLIGYGLSILLENILSLQPSQLNLLREIYLIALITASLGVIVENYRGTQNIKYKKDVLDLIAGNSIFGVKNR